PVAALDRQTRDVRHDPVAEHRQPPTTTGSTGRTSPASSPGRRAASFRAGTTTTRAGPAWRPTQAGAGAAGSTAAHRSPRAPRPAPPRTRFSRRLFYAPALRMPGSVRTNGLRVQRTVTRAPEAAARLHRDARRPGRARLPPAGGGVGRSAL